MPDKRTQDELRKSAEAKSHDRRHTLENMEDFGTDTMAETSDPASDVQGEDLTDKK